MFKVARRIYENLQDEISRKIFLARIGVSVTGSYEPIMELSNEYKNLNADIGALYKAIRNTKFKRRVIFGAGTQGRVIADGFKRLSFSGFIDNYRREKLDEITGLPIYTLPDYIDLYGRNDTLFLISVVDPRIVEAIQKQLFETGILDEAIVSCPVDWRNNTSQYFDFFSPRPNESFVDCGCFDGSSAFGFAAWCRTLGYERIWSFEPDENSYQKCKSILSVLDKCEVYPYGISRSTGRVLFDGNGHEDAKIVTEKIIEGANIHAIETIDLDSFLAGERVTFIKMDIEGAELDGLIGAQTIIKEQKPRLAISVYHNAEHIITIPEYLLSLRSDYKLSLRHYSLLPNETILYAE